jgi:hypothetical protein
LIAIDTNVLVYAHRAESPWHDAAVDCLRSVARGPWAIPWPCLHEFLAIVTHPRIFDPPTPLGDALQTVEGWLEAPTLSVLAEVEDHWDVLSSILRSGRVLGPQVHDARIAAICLEHAVEELWTADRDFTRFPKLRTHNPLVAAD